MIRLRHGFGGQVRLPDFGLLVGRSPEGEGLLVGRSPEGEGLLVGRSPGGEGP